MSETLFLHIIIIVLVSLIISWFASKFFQLPVDIFNAANGLLLAFLFTFGTVQEVSTHNANMDQSLTIVLLMAQFAVGIMVVVAYLAFKKYKEENEGSVWSNMLKISFAYSFSLLLSLFSYYIASILYIYRNSIFIVQPGVKGGLSKVILNIWQFNEIDLFEFLIILFALYLASLVFNCRSHLRLIIVGNPNQTTQGEQNG